MKYNLSFNEAMEVVLSKEAWIQGEDFASDVVLMMSDDVLVVKNFISGCTYNPSITTGLYRQKFRKVYTQPDAQK